MVQSYDVGSLPLCVDIDKYVKGANSFEAGLQDEWAAYFEKSAVKVFLDKLNAGIDIPNFPQFRDMSTMFLSMVDGLEKIRGGYVETGRLSLKPDKECLPEVSVVKKNIHEISEEYEKPFRMKVCITGPYTLASFFPFRTGDTFSRLGGVLSLIVERNVFWEKIGHVEIVSIDEPLFGLVDDSLLDRGSVERENLFKAWTNLFHSAKARKVRTCLHLHNTSDGLFWGVKSLDIVESHVGDPLYEMKETKKRLEEEDKVLKASVCVVDFDSLIKETVVKASARKFDDSALNEAVADTWEKLQQNSVAAEDFLEPIEVMRQRVMQVIERFGAERVPFVGPECGLRGFPTYQSAIECLRRVAEMAQSFRV